MDEREADGGKESRNIPLHQFLRAPLWGLAVIAVIGYGRVLCT